MYSGAASKLAAWRLNLEQLSVITVEQCVVHALLYSYEYISQVLR